ncbi:Protein phosphatase [Phytophthora cinnamomi]|uniref:Protein phosphatase n=1 Tax=Phytophthora cinnamomi TaxID=4785 RepID=UPI003559404F|nr:Protein phosphatase [Phytophthora cinnamomi]
MMNRRAERLWQQRQLACKQQRQHEPRSDVNERWRVRQQNSSNVDSWWSYDDDGEGMRQDSMSLNSRCRTYDEQDLGEVGIRDASVTGGTAARRRGHRGRGCTLPRAALWTSSPFSHSSPEFPASEIERSEGRGLIWMGLARAAAAEPTEDPKEIAKHIQEHKEEVKAAAKKNESKKCTLRKRETSVRDGKMVVSTTAVRGDCTYMEETAYVSAFKRFVAMYDSHGGAAPAQPALLHDRAGVRAAGPRGSGGNQDEKGRHRAAAGGAQANQEVIVKNDRAVLCRSGDAVEFTRDHKPNDLQERARIESLGGRVQWYGCMDAQREPIEPYGAYRVNDDLAVARAIGDRDTRSFVISDADIRQYDIEYDKDEFIVIASDGLSRGLEQRRPQRHPRAWSQQYTSDRSIIKAAQRRRKVQITNYLVQEALFWGTSTTCPLWWSGCSTTPSYLD